MRVRIELDIEGASSNSNQETQEVIVYAYLMELIEDRSLAFEVLDEEKTYAVTIKASVTKTISVEADNEKDAVEQAHQEFSILNDANPEHYEQDTVNVEEI